MAQRSCQCRGVLQRKPVTAGSNHQLTIREEVNHPPANGQELRVALADDHGHGHPQLRQPVPQRLHLPRADAAQYAASASGRLRR